MKKVLLTVLTTALVLCSVLFIGAACSDGTENGNNEIYSVYQTYVAYAEANGTTPLTYEEWLKTIKGENGKDGADGKDGENGLSAYELYKKYSIIRYPLQVKRGKKTKKRVPKLV